MPIPVFRAQKNKFHSFFFSNDTAQKLATSLIFSKLDYCNSLLFGLPQNKIQRLQSFQNNAARLILQKRKHEEATPLLKELHWLPIQKRVFYKAATMVFKCRSHTAPAYLLNKITPYRSGRGNLRSSNDQTKLSVPRTKTKSGERSFSYFGPTIWNGLPRDLRECDSCDSFKRELKTFLFALHYV